MDYAHLGLVGIVLLLLIWGVAMFIEITRKAKGDGE